MITSPSQKTSLKSSLNPVINEDNRLDAVIKTVPNTISVEPFSSRSRVIDKSVKMRAVPMNVKRPFTNAKSRRSSGSLFGAEEVAIVMR